MKTFYCLALAWSFFLVSYASELSEDHMIPSQADELIESGQLTVIYPEDDGPKYTALVVHGLNNPPEAMIDIIDELTQQGAVVFNAAFSGHFEKDPKERESSYHQYSPEEWKFDIYQSYLVAKQHADATSTKLVAIGYSTGGLLINSLLLDPEYQFEIDKQILFAPALGLRYPNFVLRLIQKLPLHYELPSKNHDDFKVHGGVSIASLKNLKTLIDHFYDYPNLDELNQIPALIFLDLRDENIPYKQINYLLYQYDLTSWDFITFKDRYRGDQRFNYRHLIISKDFLSAQRWQDICQRMKDFL